VLTQEAAQKTGSSSQQTGQSSKNPTNAPKASEFNPVNVLMNQLYKLHPPNIKYNDNLPIFIHPTESGQFIPLTQGAIEKWAQAIVSQLGLIIITVYVC
jgi:hypothetical protein